MLVVQRVEGGNSHLGFAHVPGRRLLLPEPIGPAEVQELVATHPGVRRGLPPGKSRERREGCRDGVGDRAVVVVGDLATESIVPFTTDARVDLKARSGSLDVPGESLTDLLV